MSVNQVKAAIVAALQADSALTSLLTDGTAGIHHAQAPAGANLPLIVYQKPAGTPAYTMGQKAWDNDIYNVKCVATDDLTAGSAAARIDAALTDANLTVSGGSCLYIRRVADIDYPETSDGKTYFHTGASFRVWTT